MPLSSIFQLYHGGELQKIMYNTSFSPFQLHFLFLNKLSETSTKIKYNTSIAYWLKAVNDFETWSKWQVVATKDQFFIHIMVKTRHFWWDVGDVCVVLDHHADFYSGRSPKNQLSTARLDMSLNLDNLSWFRDNPSFFLILQCSILGGEAVNTNFKIVCLTQTVLDPMIYNIRGEPANHHTIDLFIKHITEIRRTV